MNDITNLKDKIRVRYRIDNENGKELKPEDYGRIVGAWEFGGSFGKIAKAYGIGKTTVKQIIDRFQETRSPLPAKRPGASPKVSQSQKNYMVVGIRRNPTDNFTDHWKSAKLAGINICLQTYKKYVREMGFDQYGITEVPYLKPIHKVTRLAWCLERAKWTVEQWGEVIWTDESMFRLGRGAAGVTVIRMAGEELQDRYTVKTLKFGKGSLMMWGCFHAKALGPIVLMEGIIDQDKYVSMLAESAIPWLETQCSIYNRDFIYQEDGAPIHTGKYAKWYKQKNQVKGFDVWPANSPDLNPIEHIWGYLKLRVNKRVIGVDDIKVFEAIVRDEWAKIGSGYLEALVASMPARCAAVIAAKGGNTKY